MAKTGTSCRKSAKWALVVLLTFGTTLCAQTNGTTTRSDVPAGCDPNVMSEKYWSIWSDNALAEIDRDIEKYRKGVFDLFPLRHNRSQRQPSHRDR